MTLIEDTIPFTDRRTHFAECGQGPRTIVLLHGYTDSWRSFRLALPALSRNARCILPDHRAHGGSRYDGEDFSPAAFAQDIIDFLDRLDLPPVTLVGHSMGSFVARAVAMRRPDLVGRLALVGGAVRCANAGLDALLKEVVACGDQIPRAFVEEFQKGCIVDPAALPPGFLDECIEVSHRMPARVWRAVLARMIVDDDSAGLKRIACPTIVLGGDKDAVFSAEEQKQLARAIPGAKLRLYENVGHSPQWERPDLFALDIEAFAAA